MASRRFFDGAQIEIGSLPIIAAPVTASFSNSLGAVTVASSATLTPGATGALSATLAPVVSSIQANTAANQRVWYPFWRPSGNLNRLIADIYVQFVDSSLTKVLPFQIDWLYGFGTLSATVPITPVHAHDIKITDFNGVTVFDSLTANYYAEHNWGSVNKILEWSDANGNIVRVVKRVSTDDAIPVDWPEYFEPEFSWISPRTVEKAPTVVTSLAVATSLSQAGDIAVSGLNGIIFRPGHNMELSGTEESSDGSRRAAVVLLDNVPGSGAGRFPGCDSEPVLRTLAGAVASDSVGTVLLSGDNEQCHKIMQPAAAVTGGDPYYGGVYYGSTRTVTLEQATLKIENDCSVCCDCDSYIAVYEAIRKLTRTYLELGRRSEIVRNRLRRIITRWEKSRTCREDHALQLLVQPYSEFRVGIAGSVCNNTDNPIHNVTMTLDFSATTITGCVVCDSTFRKGNVDPYTNKNQYALTPYKLGGSWPTYTAQWDCINPGENGYIAFLLQFEESGLIRGTVSAVGAELPIDAFTNVSDSATVIGSSTDPDCCPTSDDSFNATLYDSTPTDLYYGGEYDSGEWKIVKVALPSYTETSATVDNNPGYLDLTSAWAARLSLVYA